MNNHTFNNKLLFAVLLMVNMSVFCHAEEIVEADDVYPATVENAQETFFKLAPKNEEQVSKRKFFSFGKRSPEKELSPVHEDLASEVSNTSEDVNEDAYVASEELENTEKNKFKKIIDKVKLQEDSSKEDNDVVFADIQQKIESEKLFKNDTVNKVYLDRFRPTVETDTDTYYENRMIEKTKDNIQLVVPEGQKSIIELIKDIEDANPDDTSKPLIELSLCDCVGIAIAKHPSIASAQLNKDIYKSRIIQAWATYFPDLSASLDYSYLHSKVPNYSYGMKSAYFPNVSAGLLLFDFGKTKAMVDIATTDYSGSKYDLQNSINEIIYAVKAAYYNLVFAQKQIDIYKTTIEEFELQLKAAQKYFAIGKKPQIDVVIAEYNVGSAKLNLVKAINTYEVAKINLANTLGLPEFANFKLVDELSKQSCEEILEGLLEDAFTIRPDLLSQEKLVESSLLSVRKAKRDFTPDLRANGSLYRGGVDPYKETNYNVGVNLSYSGMNLLQLKKEYEIAVKNYKKNLVDYESKRQNVYLEVKQAYIDMMSSKETVKQAALNVDQAKAQHYHAAGRYNAGLGDAIELKDSENTYMSAQLEYFSALLDYNTNIANLERVVGRPVEASTSTL